MVRFELSATDSGVSVYRARDTITGRDVILERHLRSERLRKLQAIPPSTVIARFERSRSDHQLQLVHPAPMALPTPADEFAIAQAIGSLLDGLALLHANGVAHGAVNATALTDGPTGGRLSLAGAFGATNATPEDDVYAASALAFEMIVGVAPGADARDDSRLEHSASPAMTRAIRAGLDENAAQRPSAALHATMVRGEFLSPLPEAEIHDPFFVRLHAAVHHAVQTRVVKAGAGVGAAIAAVALVATLSSAGQPDTSATAMPSLAEEPAPARVLSATVTRAQAPSTTVAPVTAAAAAPEASTSTSTTRLDPPAPAVVLVTAAAPDEQPRPPITVAPPSPTTIAPKPVPPTAPTSTMPVTTRATTTTAAKPGKGKGAKADK
jgi:hypothetical protein